MRAGEVFVSGGQPAVTYASREVDASALEDRLDEYLEDERSILVVTGPSKSGKTVLLRHILPPRSKAVWVPGARMRSIEDVWARVVAELQVWTDERKSVGRSDSESTARSGRASAKPLLFEAGAEWSGTDTTADTSSHERARSRALPEAAAEALIENRLPLVIDDFHHLQRDVQTALVGALKDLVFDGLPVILAAVPHRLVDAVKSLPEMNGRVEHIGLGLWTPSELRQIALQGFGPGGLNALCAEGLAEALARQAARSPHLMQRLCLELARANGIKDSLEHPRAVEPPNDWKVFNRQIAEARTTDREVRCLLDSNPVPEPDRERWTLSSGDVVDLHGLILTTIADAGAFPEITLSSLVDEIRVRVPREPPRRPECLAALTQMARAAESVAVGPNGERADPVIDLADDEGENPRLHVLDPLFAFRLQWAPPFASWGPEPTPEDLAFQELERRGKLR